MFKSKALQFSRYSTDLNFLTGGKQDDWMITGSTLFNSLRTEDIVFKFYNLRTQKTVDSIDYREPYFIKACVRAWNLLEDNKKSYSNYDRLYNTYQSNDSLSWMFNNTIFTSNSSFSLTRKTKELSEIYKDIFTEKEIEEFIISLTDGNENGDRKFIQRFTPSFNEAVSKGFNPNLLIFSDYYSGKIEEGITKRTEGNEIIHSHELSLMAMEKLSWSYTNASNEKDNFSNEIKRHHVRNHPHLAFLMKQDSLDDLREIYKINDFVDFRIINHQFINDDLHDVLNFVNERLLNNRRFLLSCPWFKDPSFLSEFVEFNIDRNSTYIDSVPPSFIKKAIKQDESLIECFEKTIHNELMKSSNIYEKGTHYNIKKILSILPKKSFSKELFINLKAHAKTKKIAQEGIKPLHVIFFSRFPESLKKKHQEEIFNDFPFIFQHCTKDFQAIEDNYMKAANYGTDIDFHNLTTKFNLDLYFKVLEILADRDSGFFGVEKKHVHNEFIEILDKHNIGFLLKQGRREIIFIYKKDIEALKILVRKERLETKLSVKGITEKRLKI